MAGLCIIVNFLTFLCFHYCEAAGRCCVLSFGSSLSRLDRSACISQELYSRAGLPGSIGGRNSLLWLLMYLCEHDHLCVGNAGEVLQTISSRNTDNQSQPGQQNRDRLQLPEIWTDGTKPWNYCLCLFYVCSCCIGYSL